ncbi:hypothetical protein Taro_031055, partial [Colocasia esculenta]|nr:hypothetical protein [Colocasia esculenta]
MLHGGVPVSRAVQCVPSLADGPFWWFPEGVPCVPMPAGLVLVTSHLCHFLWWLPRQISFAQCSALEGLPVRQVIIVTWDAQPRASVSEGVALSGGRAQVSDLEQKGKMHCVPVHRCALCSAQSSFAHAKQMLVCRVAPLVERCDTCLWLLPALCWLVGNSGEVLREFFSVGSGGGEVFPRTLLCSFLVVAALPSSCGASLGCCVLVVFPITICCCPSKSSSPSGTAFVLVEVFCCVASLVLFRCGPASPSHCLALRWFWSRVGRSGVGPQFGRTAVFVVVFFAVTH